MVSGILGDAFNRTKESFDVGNLVFIAMAFAFSFYLAGISIENSIAYTISLLVIGFIIVFLGRILQVVFHHLVVK